MSGDNKSLSESYKIAGDDWTDKDAAARLLEETKSLLFAQKCAMLGDIPVNRAEQTVKASKEWYDHVVKVVDAKTEANKARIWLETLRMRHSEHMNEEANHRAESRL